MAHRLFKRYMPGSMIPSFLHRPGVLVEEGCICTLQTCILTLMYMLKVEHNPFLHCICKRVLTVWYCDLKTCL